MIGVVNTLRSHIMFDSRSYNLASSPARNTHFTNTLLEAKIQVVLCWCFSPKIASHISPRKKTPPDFKAVFYNLGG